MKITGALAVALLLGNVTPMDMDNQVDMMGFKGKLSNPKEAEEAQRKYNHALVDFYDALPRGAGRTYRQDMKKKAVDLKESYAAWHAKTKMDMEYVDPETFMEYYEDIKAKEEKRKKEEEAKKKAEEEAKKKAEEEAKKKAEEEAKKKAEEEKKKKAADDKKKAADDKKKDGKKALVLADDKKPEPKDYAWVELDKLKNAGVSFDNHVQHAVVNLGKGELNQAGIFYTQAIKNMASAGGYSGLNGYKSMVAHYKVPVKEFEIATKAVKDAKHATYLFVHKTPGLQDFAKDKDFMNIYLKGIAEHKGLPSLEHFEAALEKHKKDKMTPYIKQAIVYMKKLKESDRVKFNKLFSEILVKAKAWYGAAKKMDNALVEVGKTLKLHHSAADVQKASGYVTNAIQQRNEMYQVWKALQNLNAKEVEAQKEAEEYQEDVDKENKANTALIVIIVLTILLTVGGVTYCKVAKKACFAEKDDVSANEGGECDKTLFKSEIKSKKSHKKSRKESLMPTFKVADEQA